MDVKDLQKLTRGALRIWEEEGFIRLSRFTEKQHDALGARGYHPFREATAGIKFVFTTCGGSISFDFHAEAGCGAISCVGFDILVNGTLAHHVYKEGLPYDGRVEYEVEKTDAPCKVELYLSNVSIVKLKNIVFPADAAPLKGSRKLLCMGDSITQGIWSACPSHTYVHALARALDAEGLNQGVGGDMFFAGNLDENLPFDPDIITVAYGINDYYYGKLFTDAPKAYFEALSRLYGEKDVFVILPIWYGEETKKVEGHTLEEGRDYIRSIAQGYKNITVINGKDFVPHFPEFYFEESRMHPNDLGYFYYASAIGEAVKNKLFS